MSGTPTPQTQFKKSKVGRFIITSVIVVGVSSAVIVWLYESIRIPSLKGQLEFKDDKLRSTERDLEAEKDASRKLRAETERSNSEAARWRATYESNVRDFVDIGVKLSESQRARSNSLQEIESLRSKMTTLIESNNANRGRNMPDAAAAWDRAINSMADYQDSTFLLLDNKVTKLRLSAYASFQSEIREIENSSKKNEAAILSMITAMHSYRDALLDMQSLRWATAYASIGYYLSNLVQFDPDKPTTFIEAVRQKPPVVIEMATFADDLCKETKFFSWNTNASAAFGRFMRTNATLSTMTR